MADFARINVKTVFERVKNNSDITLEKIATDEYGMSLEDMLRILKKQMNPKSYKELMASNAKNEKRGKRVEKMLYAPSVITGTTDTIMSSIDKIVFMQLTDKTQKKQPKAIEIPAHNEIKQSSISVNDKKDCLNYQAESKAVIPEIVEAISDRTELDNYTLSDVKESIASCEATLKKLTTKVNENKKKITQLRTANNDMANQIKSIKERLKDLKARASSFEQDAIYLIEPFRKRKFKDGIKCISTKEMPDVIYFDIKDSEIESDMSIEEMLMAGFNSVNSYKQALKFVKLVELFKRNDELVSMFVKSGENYKIVANNLKLKTLMKARHC